ncbi:MAG: DUF805 domain-containing protein [Bacteroidetes bacterium]|nr:DUF805 domain-containing protein [Bacteroidota bacterium]
MNLKSITKKMWLKKFLKKYYFRHFETFLYHDGRISRKDYWIFSFLNILLMMFMGFLFESLEILLPSIAYNIFEFICSIFWIYILIAWKMLDIRRMHDIGMSGWWTMIPIFSILFYLCKGDDKENKYGPS